MRNSIRTANSTGNKMRSSASSGNKARFDKSKNNLTTKDSKERGGKKFEDSGNRGSQKREFDHNKPKNNRRTSTVSDKRRTSSSYSPKRGFRNVETATKLDLFKTNKGIRINKYIAECGVCSRRSADEYIKEGLVKINKKVVTDLSTKVMPGDFITLKGDPISLEKHYIYILLNKPKDVITTSKDEKQRTTVLDIIKKQSRIYPVGRLDRNTTGALLLTNDGELAYRLTHPKYQVEKIYNALLDKSLKVDDARKIVDGIELDGEMSAPCEIFIHPDHKEKVTITLREGKNHEVKRLFEAVGYNVRQLDRKFFAGISVSGMDRGKYRNLKDKEIKDLKKLVGIV